MDDYEIKEVFKNQADGDVSPEDTLKCSMYSQCKGCRYPAHGFMCWNSDGTCLRSDVYVLNKMCRIAEQSGDIEKLGAVIRWLEPTSIDEIITLAKELPQFDFYPSIHTPEEYGRYFIKDSGRFEYDSELSDYYDYRRFGKERILQEHGVFDEAGYIVYYGTMSFDEIMNKHEEQAFTMEGFIL